MPSVSQFFNDPLLLEFMHNFYGYGNYRGAYWFIGMEEGGGDSFAEVSKRLAVWEQRGRRELEDVVAYHLALGINHPFGEKPRLQPTWAKLIRVLLSLEGHAPTREEVRGYQQRLWARSEGNVALLELLPLPSPSTSHWLYAQHSKLSSLISREQYRQTWNTIRIQALQQRITTHQPKAVVFYSFSYLPFWTQVVGARLQPMLMGELYVHHSPSTIFAVVKHPSARGVTNAYLHTVGHFLRSMHLNDKIAPAKDSVPEQRYTE
jgi:hypothetical protein